ncbi:hypothetical protein DXG03_001033, partial [Asterophora parasitica]
LSYRDDLESFVYIVLFLLGGSLAWTSNTKHHGTTFGRLRKVHKRKKRYDGARLALGLLAEFALLVEHARSLSAEELPDYDEWRLKFKHCARYSMEKGAVVQEMAPSPTALNTPPQPGTPPVKVSQVVLAQLLPAITITTYSAIAGHEQSYIHDLSLASPKWFFPRRSRSASNGTRECGCTAVAIGQWRQGATPGESDNLIKSVPIAGPTRGGATPPPVSISVAPEWPLEHSYCYAVKRTTLFYCLPSQVYHPYVFGSGP